MELSETPAAKPELDAAFEQVVEAFGATVSTQVSAFLHSNGPLIVVAVASLACVQLGVILVALGIREAVASSLPNHVSAALTGLGALCLLSASSLLFTRYSLFTAPRPHTLLPSK